MSIIKIIIISFLSASLAGCQLFTSPSSSQSETTPEPTPIVSPEVVLPPNNLEEKSLEPGHVNLISDPLPPSIVLKIENEPFDNASGPMVKGMPTHLRITFGDEIVERYPFGQPVITIIPIEEYRQMWRENGMTVVDEQFTAIQNLVQNMPAETPTRQVPVLPLDAVQATIDMVSQFQYLETDILKGYRFVARETQGLNPVINWNLFYFYVGMTFDEKYLVTMMVPVTSSVLANSMEDVSPDEMELFNNDLDGYMKTTFSKLNQLTPTDWIPDIRALDKIIQSLNF